MKEPEASLPDWYDLMLPVLGAVQKIGGRGRNEEIDAATADLMGLTPAQLAIEYPPPSTKGSKLRDRMAWSRSLLKRMGALESISRGNWAITESGQQYLRLEADEGDLKLRLAADENLAQREPNDDRIEELKKAATKKQPISMTVRDLLGMWGAGRRSATTDDRVLSTLRAHGLATEPDFESVGMSQLVAIVLATPDAPSAVAPKPTRLTIGTLPSATAGVVSVSPGHPIAVALGLMTKNDFSQLPVMTHPKALRGVITWESIALAKLRGGEATLADTTVAITAVRHDQPLLSLVPRIVDAGFVFIRGSDESITGIVTTADLSEQFASSTGPFLVLSEIELALRHAVDNHFTSEELRTRLDPNDVGRDVSGARSLSLGEILRLLEQEESWNRLGWWIDRRLFVSELEAIRSIRNEVMHFSPDPLEQRDLARLNHFLNWMKVLVFEA